MSGRIHKSRIPVKPSISLPQEIRQEIARAKQKVSAGIGLEIFRNQRGNVGDGPPLPALPDGSKYVECQIGEARPEDPRPETVT